MIITNVHTALTHNNACKCVKRESYCDFWYVYHRTCRWGSKESGKSDSWTVVNVSSSSAHIDDIRQMAEDFHSIMRISPLNLYIRLTRSLLVLGLMMNFFCNPRVQNTSKDLKFLNWYPLLNFSNKNLCYKLFKQSLLYHYVYSVHNLSCYNSCFGYYLNTWELNLSINPRPLIKLPQFKLQYSKPSF